MGLLKLVDLGFVIWTLYRLFGGLAMVGYETLFRSRLDKGGDEEQQCSHRHTPL